MISVFDYTDYRCFLRDRFSELKKADPRFSYRFFNRLAGIRSSGFLKLVMDGRRNLADDGIRGIVKGFKLPDSEAAYFVGLVKFNQARDHAERERYFLELSRNKRFIRAKPLTAAQYHLFSHWYYVAILELVKTEGDDVKDVGWLQRRIHPPVGLRELKKAVRDLMELDLLEETEEGGLRSKEAMLSTPDEVQSLSVTNFHIQMSEMAARAVANERPSDREFSALTVATSEEGFQRAKKEIQEFRKKLHSILEQDCPGKRSLVGHVNLQLFKLNS